MKRIIVLGALSAIAEATCRRLAGPDVSFALLGRDSGRLESVAADLRVRGARAWVYAQDLAHDGDCAAALDAAAKAMEGADAVLLFYGLLGDQARAEEDLAHTRAIIDVNFTSAALWMVAGARLLAAEHKKVGSRPVLLAVSSVAGDRGRRSNFVYGAAKAGLSALMQGLAHKTPVSGVRAVTVKLGFVDTPMTAGLKKGGPLWASAEQAAQVIAGAMERGGPIVYGPWFWRWIMLAIRLTPAPIFNKVNL